MNDIYEIAQNAEMIVNGYAFTKCESGYRIINLNRPEHAAVLSGTGEMLETTMDDIELKIVDGYFRKNRPCLEDEDA